MLARKIAEKNMTTEEFAVYAEKFAREHGEPGTLSHRHLQRLVLTDGVVPNLRPATRRLLEALLGVPVDELLASDHGCITSQADDDLVHRLDAASRVDAGVVRTFTEQLDGIRRLDRQFGAEYLLATVRSLIAQMESLLRYSSASASARALAGVISQAHTLAGWQSLDRLETRASWEHYQSAISAAHTAESTALFAHALAEQAVVLMEIDHTSQATEVAAHSMRLTKGVSPLLQCWLRAMHEETLAASGRSVDFSALERGGPSESAETGEPYLALDDEHLHRWRGHIMALAGHKEAVVTLKDAAERHDREYARARASLRLDLALALLITGEREAAGAELRVDKLSFRSPRTIARHRVMTEKLHDESS